jgi:hypothetical protein
MKRAPVKRHPDLFEDASPRIVMPSDQKRDLVRLIQTMLIEIVDDDVGADEGSGGGDDKDHA